jgi:hypothetical protein
METSPIITEYMNRVKEFKHTQALHLKTKKAQQERMKQDTEELNALMEFINKMDDKDMKAFEIAIDHLEDSFDIEKCISFLK